MRRVLIVRTDQLVAVGVESLLMKENSLEVKSAVLYNGKSVFEEMEAFNPDVLVLDESLLVSHGSMLFDLFNGFSSLRVIVIDINYNRLHIYDKHDVKVIQSSDLIAAIQ